jgi:hypothetical protein
MNNHPFYHFLLGQNLLIQKPLYDSLSLIPLKLEDLSKLFVFINRSITIEGLFESLENPMKIQIVIETLDGCHIASPILLNPDVYFLDRF